MAPNRGSSERINEARRRLRRQPLGGRNSTTRPRGSSAIDQRDLRRAVELLQAAGR